MTSDAVCVDFQNADVEGFVRLNTNGSKRDIARFGVTLSDGLSMLVSDGEILIHGEVCAPGPEGVWRLRVDWKEVFRLHGEL